MSLKFKNSDGGWVKIPATDDFTKLKNTPYTLIGKADTKFASIDTMYSYDTESSSPKQNVDNGLYLLKEDIDFSAKHTMNFYEYVLLSMSGSEESSITNWTFTIPKGSTMSVQDTFVTIVCPRSINYEMKTPDGSGGDSAKTFMFGALNGDNNVSCICLAKDGLESPYTYYDAILYGIFSNIGNFSEGQPIVTANSYQGSGSIPLFKLGEAGATTTSITDDSYTDYTTTEKLAKLNAGVYYVNTDKLSVNLKGIDIKSQISTLFPQTNVNENIDVEKGSQITVTVRQSGSPETGYQTQKLVNIYNTIQGAGYPYSVFFGDVENNPSVALVSMGNDLINKALSNAYSATSQISEIMNTCITDESLRGKVPVISAPDAQTATGVKNVFKAMDFPSGSVIPTFEVNDENAANYDSLEKWFSVDDGIYYINTTNVYGNNGGYIDVSKLKKVSFVGTGVTSGSSGTGTKTIEDGVIFLLNGATVIVNTLSDADGHIEKFVQFNSVYASGDLSGYVLFRKMKSDSYSSANVLFTDILTNLALAGQMSESIALIFGTDGMFPNIITESDELTSYNTLQKWMNLDPGRYLVMRNDLTVEVSAKDQSKSTGTGDSFTRTLSIPKNTFVFVYSTDDSSSSATNYKNVVFQKADNVGSGYYGEWMIFKWDSRKTYSADNVELYPLMTAAINGAAAVEMVNELSSVVDTKVDAEYVTNATKNLATKQSMLDVKDLANRQYTIILNILGSTDDSAQVLPKLNTTNKSNIVAAINELDARNNKFQDNESTSVILNNHTEYRCKVMASLNLSLPETIPDDYNSRIVFESGETATALSYTTGSIKFTGDNCDSSNVFAPAANTSYEVDVKYLGLDSSGNRRIVARVSAF